jgi:hypothetical protein
VANISVERGTLVEEQRQKVVETIAAVNEGNASVKGGTLVMKRIGEAVDVIQGGIQAMEQPQPASPDPERQFYQSTIPMEQRVNQPEQETITTEPSASAVSEVQPTNKKDLLEFIGQGEGTYDSLNRGTINGSIVGAERNGSRGGKKISELTINEIKEYQSIDDPNNTERLFTVGKYQTKPSTFEQAVDALEISGDTVFSAEVQDQIGIYLVGQKRPRLGRFLEGDEDVSVDRAMLSLAMEFASMPVPSAIKKGTYGKYPLVDLVSGDSFYKDDEAEQGNRALKNVEETREILLKTRDSSQ